MTSTKRTAKGSGAEAGKREGFTAEEREAMKERAKELKGTRRGAKADPESEVLAKIAEMPDADRALAERIHDIVRTSAPELTPRLWYGMPAYAKNGKVLCFFQSAQKFKSKYATLGFSDEAALDDGAVWPTSYAVTKLTAADERRISDLIKRAVG
ncbi:iron chaperone [Streptomyces sp. HMX87]|uniref:iron chaperone n=1 Tax=Streptomyces sp. HMX87 TaxID=3390849 RepID=UPI003A87F49C